MSIIINVGGTKFETHKSTLMKCPYFDAYYERWDNGQELFIDRNPVYFSKILDHLRDYPVDFVNDEEITEYNYFFGSSKTKNKIIINVGGTRFETRPETLSASLFFQMVLSNGVPREIFVDRDPKDFPKILKHLRGEKVVFFQDDAPCLNFYRISPMPEVQRNWNPEFIKKFKIIEDIYHDIGYHSFEKIINTISSCHGSEHHRIKGRVNISEYEREEQDFPGFMDLLIFFHKNQNK